MNDNLFDYGLLRVNAVQRNIAFPVSDATVTVFEPESGDVIAELKTDSEGQTLPVRLEAPPEAFAQDSDAPRPFSQYDVRASAEGYDDAIIKNVQIFSGSTAILDVSLTSPDDDITIPYPTLWGNFPSKIPESSIKRLPFPSNLVVLPEPVIPEFVVVHGGVPDDRTAPDYTVRFKDYINNVASSEIYASWNREALKANILAIISFTLSRVYTEWYRSKGYDFTITNSTAYDQAFTYGRNIFQEIAEVTDEIFNLYVSKSDINQPLFTQYTPSSFFCVETWYWFVVCGIVMYCPWVSITDSSM